MKLALQTFTIRKSQHKNILNALKMSKDLGFENFELSRFEWNEKDLNDFKDAKEKLNITYLNFQKTFESIDDNFDMVIRFCNELDCKVVCISVLPIKYILSNKKSISEFVEKVNTLYDRLQQKGILLTYHTHDFEYIIKGGFCSFDLMINTIKTPFIIDSYWVTRAGINVPDLIDKLNGKVHAIHLKDYNATFSLTCRSTKPVALGLGTANVKEILSHCTKNNLKYVAIEHHSNKPFEELKISMKYLKENNLMEVFK